MTLKRKKTKASTPPVSGDRGLIFAVGILLGIGLLMISSAGVAHGNVRFDDEYYFFKRQVVGLGVGLFLLFLFSKIRYDFWRKLVVPIFIFALILLVLVLLPGFGVETYGAYRWLEIGPISFQPSEFMKIALILYLAAWFSNKNAVRKTDLYEGVLPFVIVLSLVGFLILKQPDTGTLGVLFCIALAMFFVSGAKISHIAGLFASSIVALGILIKLEPYRMQRFLVFLNPEHDSSGAGYQIQQALIAIGSGGLWGVGLGHSRQKFNYLPEPVTDSIFAVIGEELGLIGCVVVISLFVFIAWRGYRIARFAPDDFGRLIAVGVVSWILFQAFINIFAISGLIPLTGIPLPLISYGGTALAVTLAALGIVLNISKQAKVK